MADEEAMPAVVYHYTSMDVLLVIVEKRQLWATNIRYLNDVSERQHCLSMIRQRVEATISNSQLATELLDQSLENEDASKSFNDLPFVTSFSADRDSLSQWRSYCPNGNGVCVGFRTDSLVNAFIGHSNLSICLRFFSKLWTGEHQPQSTSPLPLKESIASWPQFFGAGDQR